MKFSFDIRYSLFDILRFKKSAQMRHAANVRDKLWKYNISKQLPHNQKLKSLILQIFIHVIEFHKRYGTVCH
jgi:hypothetical protein